MRRSAAALAILVLASLSAGCGAAGGKRSQPAASGLVPVSYPGDAASKRDLARWMSARAYAAGLPPVLPVMAALVESGMRNLTAGDSDAAGYFQIPLRIWNQGDYAGYPQKPELQMKWFIDQALVMDERRRVAGIDTKDDATWGDWIADVERPAAQYRGRYQLRLGEARQLLRS